MEDEVLDLYDCNCTAALVLDQKDLRVERIETMDPDAVRPPGRRAHLISYFLHPAPHANLTMQRSHSNFVLPGKALWRRVAQVMYHVKHVKHVK